MRRVVIGITVACILAVAVPLGGYLIARTIPAVTGTDVYSSNAGTVVRSEALIENGRYVSYGNLIVVRDATNPSIEVYYAHLSRRQVVVGESVTPGQVIGLSGSTGKSEGPHLHFEIRVGGSSTDPMPFLQSAAGTS